MSSLANDVNPELRLPGLRIYDKAFVGGFRAAKLVGVSDDASIYALLANPSDPDRHYITCEIVALNGEVVATVFVHAGIQAHALYLEFTSWAMPPTRLGFQIVDLRRGRGLPAYLGAIGRALARMPAEFGRYRPGSASCSPGRSTRCDPDSTARATSCATSGRGSACANSRPTCAPTTRGRSTKYRRSAISKAATS